MKHMVNSSPVKSSQVETLPFAVTCDMTSWKCKLGLRVQVGFCLFLIFFQILENDWISLFLAYLSEICIVDPIS